MKPKPFCVLNHFTVPIDMRRTLSLLSCRYASPPAALRRGPTVEFAFVSGASRWLQPMESGAAKSSVRLSTIYTCALRARIARTIAMVARRGDISLATSSSLSRKKGQPHRYRPNGNPFGRRGATGRVGLRAADKRPGSIAASDILRSVHRRLHGDVPRLPDLPPPYPGACIAGRRAARARLHRPARLRPWLLLRVDAPQRDRRLGLQPADTDALHELGTAAQPAPRQLVQPRPPQGSRSLFGLPDSERISRLVALAAPAASPASPSAGRQCAVATAGLCRPLSRAVRHTAEMETR